MKKLVDQLMVDLPDLGAWNMDNLTDDPNESDYIGESGDGNSEELSFVGSLEDENQMALENQAFEPEV